MDGYGNLIAGRLRKLAAAGSTGTLPFSGHCDGAIHFHDGQVVYAESTRTPGMRAEPAGGAPLPADGGSLPAGGGPLPADGGSLPAGGGPLPPLRWLAAILAVTEPTVDAALELMSTESRYARFQPSRVPAVLAAPAAGPACRIPVDSLLAEVTRRQRLLRQLSAVVTADTEVARNPELSSAGVQVSARQWAVLIRVRTGTTPRALAWELRHSVFSTTAEVYRLLVLRLLSAAGQGPVAGQGPPAGQGPAGGHGPALISFIRAVPQPAVPAVPLPAPRRER